MQAGQRDLGGADQEELVLGDLVDLVAVAGQEAGPDQGLLADEDRRHDRLVALAADQLDREADEGQLEQDEVAHQVGEARAREPRRRLHLDQAQRGADLEVVAGLEVEARAAPPPRAASPRPPRSSRRGRRGRAGWAAPWRPARAPPRPSRARPCRTRSSPSAPGPRRPGPPPPRPAAWPRRPAWRASCARAWAFSISGSSSRRRASSASSSSTPSAAPRRASACLTRSGSERISLRSSMVRDRQGDSLPGRADSSASSPAYSATKRATSSASSPTTMFWGMIAPEKPPF